MRPSLGVFVQPPQRVQSARLLGIALEDGFDSQGTLSKDTDLDPLRELPAFGELVAKHFGATHEAKVAAHSSPD